MILCDNHKTMGEEKVTTPGVGLKGLTEQVEFGSGETFTFAYALELSPQDGKHICSDCACEALKQIDFAELMRKALDEQKKREEAPAQA